MFREKQTRLTTSPAFKFLLVQNLATFVTTRYGASKFSLIGTVFVICASYVSLFSSLRLIANVAIIANDFKTHIDHPSPPKKKIITNKKQQKKLAQHILKKQKLSDHTLGQYS